MPVVPQPPPPPPPIYVEVANGFRVVMQNLQVQFGQWRS